MFAQACLLTDRTELDQVVDTIANVFRVVTKFYHALHGDLDTLVSHNKVVGMIEVSENFIVGKRLIDPRNRLDQFDLFRTRTHIKFRSIVAIFYM